MKHIQSRDNPFFKELVKLGGSARQRGKAGQTLLDGAHLLAAYLDSGKQPQHILLNAAALHDAEIMVLLERAAGVPVTQLDDRLFAELSELKTPTGILALIDVPRTTVMQSNFALLLEGIQDPGNLGSMLRSAAAAGCDAVFLSTGCADAWSPKVLRAAMGGHFALNIHERQDLPGQCVPRNTAGHQPESKTQPVRLRLARQCGVSGRQRRGGAVCGFAGYGYTTNYHSDGRQDRIAECGGSHGNLFVRGGAAAYVAA